MLFLALGCFYLVSLFLSSLFQSEYYILLSFIHSFLRINYREKEREIQKEADFFFYLLVHTRQQEPKLAEARCSDLPLGSQVQLFRSGSRNLELKCRSYDSSLFSDMMCWHYHYWKPPSVPQCQALANILDFACLHCFKHSVEFIPVMFISYTIIFKVFISYTLHFS